MPTAGRNLFARHPWRVAAGVTLAGLTVLLIGCPNGPQNLDRYPDPSDSPYVLPWKAGTSHLCVQSNNGFVSHNGRGEFAYDWYMSTGTLIRAARAGEVIKIKQDSDRIATGDAKDNNYVRIRHSDGTVGSYLHLEHQGVLVKVGQAVAQRDVLARSSWTGRSLVPHLHFHVRKDGKQIPISFRDVTNDRGVPRTLKVYQAGALSQ